MTYDESVVYAVEHDFSEPERCETCRIPLDCQNCEVCAEVQDLIYAD